MTEIPNSEAPKWETSKENVAPMKHGRNPVVLESALSLSPEELEQKRRAMYAQMEDGLKNGDDPLGSCDTYVNFTLSHYTAGSNVVIDAIEKTCRRFAKSQRYRNDIRLTRLWVRYADVREDCLDVYAYMKKHRIGETHALLYEAWANTCERKKDYERAEEVFRLGKEKRAQPAERLAQGEKDFIRRQVARKKREDEKKRNKEVKDMVKQVRKERGAGIQKERSSKVDALLNAEGHEGDDGDDDGREDGISFDENGRRLNNAGANKKGKSKARPALGSISERQARTGLRPMTVDGCRDIRNAPSSSNNEKNSNVPLNIYVDPRSDKPGQSNNDDADIDDNNDMPQPLPPTRAALRKENESIPTKWAGETLVQKENSRRKVFAATSGVAGSSSFEVYEGSDENAVDNAMLEIEEEEVVKDTASMSIHDDEDNGRYNRKRGRTEEDQGLKVAPTKKKGLSIRKEEEMETESNDDAMPTDVANETLPPSPTINTRLAMQAMDESMQREMMGLGNGKAKTHGNKHDRRDGGDMKKSSKNVVDASDTARGNNGGNGSSRKLFVSGAMVMDDDEDNKSAPASPTINTKLAMQAIDAQFNASPSYRHEDDINEINMNENMGDLPKAQKPRADILIFDDNEAEAQQHDHKPLSRNPKKGTEINVFNDKPVENTTGDEQKLVEFYVDWTKTESKFGLLCDEDPENLERMFDLQAENGPLVSLSPFTLVRGRTGKSVVVLAEDLNDAYGLRLSKGSDKDSDGSDSDSDEDDEEHARIAVKISDPGNLWEFYMYRTLEKRMCENHGAYNNGGRIPQALSFMEGTDRSYLTLDNASNASLEDIISNYHGQVPEYVAMFLVVDLLYALECLHACDIIHNDVTVQNVLLRNDDDDDGEWGKQFGSKGWNKRGIALIDFNRAIDAKHWRVSGGDVQKHIMNMGNEFRDDEVRQLMECENNESCGFNVDCIGVAVIIRKLLGLGPDENSGAFENLKQKLVWKYATQSLLDIPGNARAKATQHCMETVRKSLEKELVKENLLKLAFGQVVARMSRAQSKRQEGGNLWKN